MPELTSLHLLLVVLASLGAPLCGPRAWRWWRLAAGTAWLWVFDVRALVAVTTASALAFGLGPVARRAPSYARPIGVLLLVGIFLVVRQNAPKEGGSIVAPLGFAFLMLRLLHYWIETCAGRFPAHRWLDVFGWLSYLPTVAVGPVQRFEDWLQWEARHRFDAADAAWGLRRMLEGYAKLVFGAYTVCGTWLPDHLLWLPPAVGAAVVSLLVLYLSFAGLSDMAIGLGRIWGQRIPENFTSPFTQPTLPRYWQSWHRTVGAFCRSYVFVPMLATTRRPILAAAAAIAVFALWHEPKLPWLAWGTWHGLGIYAWRKVGIDDTSRWPVRAVSTVATWGWVLAGSVLLTSWPEGDAWWTR